MTVMYSYVKVRVSIEPLLYDEGVDFMIWAHEHNYQRIFPIYNYTMCKGSNKQPYTNPTGPVHITTGSAVSIIRSLILTVCFLSSYLLSEKREIAMKNTSSNQSRIPFTC